jgi:HMG (high mobility group) box
MVKKNAGKGKDKAKNKRTKRPPKKEGPKKPLSGFMFFSSERRKSLKDEQPDLKITEASVVIGSEWKKLTEAEKAPYIKLAKEDKDRYEKDKEKYESASKKKEETKDEDEEEDEEPEKDEKDDEDEDSD